MIRILSIGNSFSDDADQYLYDILKENGYDDIKVANLYIGGCSLERHYNNMINDNPEYEYRTYTKEGYKNEYNVKISDSLKDEWDYITMQQASHESGVLERFYEPVTGKTYIELLKELVLKSYKGKNNPEFFYHMTWSYDKDNIYDNFLAYNRDKSIMDKGIVEVIDKVIKPSNLFDGIIPNYYVAEEIRALNNERATRDGFHMTLGYGRYATGLMFASIITGKGMKNITKTYDSLPLDEKELGYKAFINVYDRMTK